jgi:hypothetical protein
MGIKFNCPACGRALNVKSELGGKRGRCPKCQAKIAIPADNATDSKAGAESGLAPSMAVPTDVPPTAVTTAAMSPAPASAVGAALVNVEGQAAIPPSPPGGAPMAGVDPISEAPNLQWYAMPPGAANQYGPASGEEFRGWVQEGRITADALVWRQDWADWKRAGSVFPQIEPPPVAGAPVAAAVASMPLPTAVAAMPMTAGMPPVAQAALPVAGAMPGVFPTVPMMAPAAEGFAIAAPESTATRGTVGRGRGYRSRSNTGPIIAIVVLLLAMIPLSFFVWKVISEQIGSPPPAEKAATGPKPSEE